MKSYGAKIIIAGEYTVLNGGNAYAIPSMHYSAHWIQSEQKDQRLIDYLPYLIKNSSSYINTALLEHDLNQGWQLMSTIPIGSGLGSSGSVVAAIYDRYGFQKNKTPELVKTDLQVMEGYFHHKSSGIDPLVIYYDKGLLLNQKSIEFHEAPSNVLQHYYLLDSMTERKTAGLVAKFQQNIEGPNKHEYRKLTQLNNELILAIMNADIQSCDKIMRQVSMLQYHLFDFAIPDALKKSWKVYYDQEKYIKLCGAGGGGYFLVWSQKEMDSPCVV